VGRGSSEEMGGREPTSDGLERSVFFGDSCGEAGCNPEEQRAL